jgi:hypothetical protein
MKTFRETVLCSLAAIALVSALAFAQSASKASAAAEGLEKLKALQGEWIDVDGVFGKKGAVAVTYRVTSGGKSVLETFPVNSAEEMTTVYHVDGNDLVLTHYCSGGTQPRMRSRGLTSNTLVFDYERGDNIDPAVTSHMHSAQIEFLSADEIRATWNNWSHGKPDDHKAMFRIVRKR